MLLNIILLIIFFLHSSHHCCGIKDVPFLDETLLCSEGIIDRRDELPLYEPSFDRIVDVAFSPDAPLPLPFLRRFSEDNDPDVPYSGRDTPQLRLKKRSVTESREIEKDDGDQYEVRFLTPLLRETRDKEDIKTIHLSPSFTPRLGRSQDGNINGASRDLKAEGRSEKKNKINLLAGSAFTPRLGRSENSPRIRFQAGSAFTPRLGRSRDFTSRQQRANRINLNAGSAFTPRLGRSDGTKMIVNAGSSFTPRLGRSEDRSRIQLNAGSAFTPRLG
ncbi:uncharacterized protein [Parasteatoda tepidariorum]|uniref:uncharacterized protein n=1 Tax=Parasteatoda tepidariorum TaxID=114398 RepID=UPI001C72259A|nr:uncharacterized protein LOC107445836 [Parasteatoda tepidariorum]